MTFKCPEGAFQRAKRHIGHLSVMTLLRQFLDEPTLAFNKFFGFGDVALSFSQML